MVTDPILTGNLNYAIGKDAVKRFTDGSLESNISYLFLTINALQAFTVAIT